jgi:surface carbohydrate biosynthesis protein
MSDKRSTLIIPVESQVRELDAKLLLACAAVERGFPVVMGSRAYVHHAMASFPKGVYLAKSMRKMSDRMFAIITKLGHEIVAWDEEGLVRFPDRFYYQRRLSAKALRNVQILLAWGNDDARAFRAFEGYPGCPIHVTGNPRIDLMRPELRRSFDREVEDIRGRYGDFVLVNTNFSGLNHFHDSLSELKWNLEPENGMGGDPFMAGRAAFRNEVLGHFKQLVPTLSRLLPDHKVVVRPHPSENHQLWTDVAQGLDNVEVVNHGNVHPWVIASRALIHNGCTTAVEAAILGTPAVAFQPVTDEIYDMILPNSLSHHAHDLKDVEKTVRAIVDGALGVRDDPEVEETLAEHVAALSTRATWVGCPRLRGGFVGWRRERISRCARRSSGGIASAPGTATTSSSTGTASRASPRPSCGTRSLASRSSSGVSTACASSRSTTTSSNSRRR